MYTQYAGDAGMLLLMKRKLIIGKNVLFLIILHCQFQGEGQDRKQTSEYQ